MRHGLPTIEVARRVAFGIEVGELDWARDFGGLHPSARGYTIYARLIESALDRLLAGASEGGHPRGVGPVDRASYGSFDPVELATAQDLDGFVLFDGSGERHAFSGTVLAPGEALVLFDQGDHSDIPGAMTSSTGSLSLNNAGDVLTLVDAEGSVHDEVSWTTSEEGVSWNRAWDGSADAALQLHDTLTPSGMECSPGLRVSGLPW